MASKQKTDHTTPPVLSPEQAIEKYEGEVKTQPTAVNYRELGSAYYIARRWDDAVGAFEKAVALDPSLAFAYYYLGVLYAAQGQRDKADAALAQLLQVSNNPMLKEQAQARIPKIKSLAELGAK